MTADAYTLGVWKVKPGLEAQFIAAWEPMLEFSAKLRHPPGSVTVIQDVTDPTRFFSFAPWSRPEDVEEMRGDPAFQARFRHLADLCTEATPGTFHIVARSETDGT